MTQIDSFIKEYWTKYGDVFSKKMQAANHQRAANAKFMESKFAQEPSLAELAEAFAFQLENQLKLQGKRVGWVGPGTLGRSQFNISLICNKMLKMEDLLPDLVGEISKKIPTNCLFVKLEIPIPNGIYGGATGEFGGVCVRAIEDYCIVDDTVRLRFDVLIERVVEEWQGLGLAGAGKSETGLVRVDGEAEKRRLEDQVFKPLSSPKAKAEAKPKDPIPLRALDFANRSARPFTSPDQYKFVPDSWK